MPRGRPTYVLLGRHDTVVRIHADSLGLRRPVIAYTSICLDMSLCKLVIEDVGKPTFPLRKLNRHLSGTESAARTLGWGEGF